MSDLALFPLTDEHKMIRDTARDFAQKEIAPIAAEFDESGEFPHKTIQKMGAMGFMGIEVPEAYGGAGMDTLSYVLALEEISKVDAAHGVIMSVNNSLFSNSGRKNRRRNIYRPWPLAAASARIRSPSLCRVQMPARCVPAPCGTAISTS